MFTSLVRIGSRAPRRTLRPILSCTYSSEAPQPPQAIEKRESRKPPPKTTHYRVTLFRSPIGLEKRRHDSLFSLGLRRRMDVVYHRHSPDAAGLILSVKEILKVENVTEQEYRLGKLSSRKLIEDDRGFRLIRNVLNRD
ncbi:hypothetical protein MJO28_006250 [Puccinia striiformis f. sp. tritici]|uniref:Uncharacterized protein n=1 Tax=Puccinia striiformis f. sp. tritici TaxID=168172 RepID=A0ACC0EGK1_9BASI|nr:hypothetical protein Pst134EA_011451 [Puccinia striiformis f. sp. tritici]KAH9467829.1 hypothetical protein Pst134EA_011451 [Puccinia striiformis f. sp. tritici]KAI7953703.1 hypothetical protein MJO28_006250 [Puccinia striiformis f. sp. tritici]KAI7958017.1 hypothetical protein MJO29_006234 [Puccinia striiformis f. sp. tritici]